MGLGVAITSLNAVGQLVALVPIAGTYCEKMLGAATQLCEIAEVCMVYIGFQSHMDTSTDRISYSVPEITKKNISNSEIKSQDTPRLS
jgi:hypothetical protein